jgi:Fe-S cluster assembly ATPase SufC
MLKIIRSKETSYIAVWLQDPSEINGVNLNNVRREASRHFRSKKREYLKGKINEQ